MMCDCQDVWDWVPVGLQAIAELKHQDATFPGMLLQPCCFQRVMKQTQVPIFIHDDALCFSHVGRNVYNLLGSWAYTREAELARNNIQGLARDSDFLVETGWARGGTAMLPC